tara:strand:- start:209 stop:2185 length:1977 start_codon:yes stop_codon:yes gene_type:complete
MRNIILVCVLLTVPLQAQTIPTYIAQDSLIAWYPFNGNANDESGNGNNGTVSGASLTSDKNGNENSAYSFNGQGNNIDLGNSEQYRFSDFTISLWYKTTRVMDPAAYLGIITKGEAFEINLGDGDGGGNGNITAVLNNLMTDTRSKLSDSTNYSDDKWHNIIISRNISGNIFKIYIDGELRDSSHSGGNNLLANSDNLLIGKKFNKAFFEGQIDDIAIWRRALNEIEILAAYKQTTQSTDNPSSLASRSLLIDSTYTKKGFKFSNYISLDTLATSDSLISYEFNLDIPDGVTYDSLRVFHSESTPSVTTNYENGILKVVTSGSGFITSYNPMIELFYTSDTTGTYSLTPTNVVLNTTNITNITSGVMKIDPFIKGDVDDSGVIQAYDASIILHQNVGSEILEPDPVKDWENGPWFNWRDSAADVDGDGDIIALDASYISQLIAGLITEFPTSTPSVESVIIEVTERGLKFTAPENIQSLNIEIPATQQVEFRDPELFWNNSTVAMNKAEGMQVAVASTELAAGKVLEIPLYVYTNDNITLEVTTISNNTKKDHQIVVSGLTVNNETGPLFPQQYILSQNYPNPFNPSTQIQYALPEATLVTLEVFNSLGQKVMELVNEQKSAGYHTATFDASGLSSGVYLYKLSTSSFAETKTMLLIK